MNIDVSSLKPTLVRRFLIDLLYRLGLFPFVQDIYQRLKYSMDLSLNAETAKFFRESMTEGFVFVDFLTMGAKDAYQDMCLFLKPEG